MPLGMQLSHESTKAHCPFITIDVTNTITCSIIAMLCSVMLARITFIVYKELRIVLPRLYARHLTAS